MGTFLRSWRGPECDVCGGNRPWMRLSCAFAIRLGDGGSVLRCAVRRWSVQMSLVVHIGRHRQLLTGGLIILLGRLGAPNGNTSASMRWDRKVLSRDIWMCRPTYRSRPYERFLQNYLLTTLTCSRLYAIGLWFPYRVVRPCSSQTVVVCGYPRLPIRKSFIYSPVVYCTHVQ